jgi:hypothetical protein
MFFGQWNAAQTLQHFMDEVLRGHNFCFAYLVDILVFFRSLKRHERHLRALFAVFKHTESSLTQQNVSSEHPWLPSSVTKYLPRVPDHWRYEWPICRIARPLRLPVSSGASWACLNFTADFCPTLLLSRHRSMPLSLAPEARVLTQSSRRRTSKEPLKGARRVYHTPLYWRTLVHPRHLHSCTRHRRFHFRHWCCAAAVSRQRLAAPLLFQEAEPGPTKIQRIWPRAAGCLWGRETFPSHAGSASLHHIHR